MIRIFTNQYFKKRKRQNAYCLCFAGFTQYCGREKGSIILGKEEHTQVDLRKLFQEVLYANSVSIVRLYTKLEKRGNSH